jgi:hypothetical protein
MRFAASVGTGVSCPPMRSVSRLDLNMATKQSKMLADEGARHRWERGTPSRQMGSAGRRRGLRRGGGPFVGLHRNRIAEVRGGVCQAKVDAESRMKSSQRASARL